MRKCTDIKIFYFTLYDILRIQTNQIGDVRLCEGFAENGCDVELIVPYVIRKDNLSKDEVLNYYHVSKPFKIRYLKTRFRDSTTMKLRVVIILPLITLKAISAVIKNRKRNTMVIFMSRNQKLLIPIMMLKKVFRLGRRFLTISWVHEVLPKRLTAWAYRNSDGVVGTNSAINEDLNHMIKIPAGKMAVSMNPITETQLKNTVDKHTAREKIGYNDKTPLIVYTGKLLKSQKEIEFILGAAKLLPGYNFLFTGGRPGVIEFYKEYCRENRLSNCIFTGYIPDYSQIRYYQFAADVLVSYYTLDEHLVRYNLPNKICEYMLTGNPIITPNFPALRDTLNEENAVFVEPENAHALAAKITEVLENKAKFKKIAEQAFNDVKEFTFKKRMKILVDFFMTL